VSDFPTFALKGARTAACVFCAAFTGRQDVAYVEAAGVRDVTLVDSGVELMRDMAKRFPKYHREIRDWRVALERWENEDRRFDVITLDPWTNMDEEVQREVRRFAELAKRWLVLGVGQRDHIYCIEYLMGLDVHLVMRNPQTGAMWLAIRRE
jgi:hypothetical protein